MIQTIELHHEKLYDCIVVGGGVAGVSAALSAARAGRSVLLLEKACTLGGLATLGLINWYEPLCNQDGRRVVGGIATELLNRLVATGKHTVPAEWEGAPDRVDTKARLAGFFSPSLCALMLLDVLSEAGVTVKFDALATYPDVEGARCNRVRVETKSGTEYYSARFFVDATGDADLFFRAGAPTVDGVNYLSYVAHIASKDSTAFPSLHTWELTGAAMTGEHQPDGIAPFVGVDNESENVFLQYGQRALWKKTQEQGMTVTALPAMAQYRMTRHIRSAYDLTAADVNTHLEDSVGVVGDFRAPRRYLEVAYRSLYTPALENVYAAGRIIGADGDAWQITRVIPAAAMTGEAAGLAVDEALRQGTTAQSLRVGLLQARLRERGFTLHRRELEGD